MPGRDSLSATMTSLLERTGTPRLDWWINLSL